jgi:hypothetical protein
VNKARGKSGPLFDFGVKDDIRLLGDASMESQDVHAGKVRGSCSRPAATIAAAAAAPCGGEPATPTAAAAADFEQWQCFIICGGQQMRNDVAPAVILAAASTAGFYALIALLPSWPRAHMPACLRADC